MHSGLSYGHYMEKSHHSERRTWYISTFLIFDVPLRQLDNYWIVFRQEGGTQGGEATIVFFFWREGGGEEYRVEVSLQLGGEESVATIPSLPSITSDSYPTQEQVSKTTQLATSCVVSIISHWTILANMYNYSLNAAALVTLVRTLSWTGWLPLEHPAVPSDCS